MPTDQSRYRLEQLSPEQRASIGRIVHRVSYSTWHWPERVE